MKIFSYFRLGTERRKKAIQNPRFGNKRSNLTNTSPCKQGRIFFKRLNLGIKLIPSLSMILAAMTSAVLVLSEIKASTWPSSDGAAAVKSDWAKTAGAKTEDGALDQVNQPETGDSWPGLGQGRTQASNRRAGGAAALGPHSIQLPSPGRTANAQLEAHPSPLVCLSYPNSAPVEEVYSQIPSQCPHHHHPPCPPKQVFGFLHSSVLWVPLHLAVSHPPLAGLLQHLFQDAFPDHDSRSKPLPLPSPSPELLKKRVQLESETPHLTLHSSPSPKAALPTNFKLSLTATTTSPSSECESADSLSPPQEVSHSNLCVFFLNTTETAGGRYCFREQGCSDEQHTALPHGGCYRGRQTATNNDR